MTINSGAVVDIGASTPPASVVAADHKFFQKVFLENFYSQITPANYGMKYVIPSNSSRVAVWKFWDDVSAKTTPLTEGVTPVGDSLQLNRKEVEVLQYGNFFEFTDRALDEGIESAWAYGSEASGQQAALTETEIVYTALQGGTNVIYSGVGNLATIDVAAGDILTTANLDSAISTLRKAHAKKINEIAKGSGNIGTTPVNATFLMFVNEDYKLNIEALTGFKSIETYAASGGVQHPGEFGAYKEVRFVADTDMPIATGLGTAGIDVYKNVMIAKDAFGVTFLGATNHELITKSLGEAGSTDPLNQRATVGWKMRVACIILYENFVMRIESALV
jgi:N4-gp56 family major capsid protein